MATLHELKVLLVEDEPIVRFVHCYMLKEIGYTPDIAENGEKALALSVNDYDLIFMDIGLPDMGGIKVTSKIRERENKENRKRSCIIALTAYSLEEVRDECFAAGMDEVAQKPIGEDALQKMIREHCS